MISLFGANTSYNDCLIIFIIFFTSKRKYELSAVILIRFVSSNVLSISKI